jgi:hypothetical protein
MKITASTALALGLCLALGACAAGGVESQHAAAAGPLSQLILGFWHGIIAPLTLIVEIINHFSPKSLPWSPQFYEHSGTGFAYDIGFYVGLASGPGILLRSRR